MDLHHLQKQLLHDLHSYHEPSDDLLRYMPDLDHPVWDRPGPHVHDWRTYIPEALQAIWADLSLETRTVAWYIAEVQADLEEWD